jgi:flagellin-like protein
MSESNGRSPLLGLLVLLAIAILLAVTNPSAESHRKEIAAEFKAERPLAGAVGLGTITSQLPEYHSAVLGSYTNAGDELTSIGLLGMVWVVDVGTR